MSYKQYLASDLVRALVQQFPAAYCQPMNLHYCATTRAWVDGPFGKYFFDYLAARNDRTWRKRGNQCEHFALRAALEAVHLFSQMEDPQIPPEAESLAVAAVAYQRADGAGWHEVNLWYLDELWVPWEPQTMSFFKFTESERLTVTMPIIP
jgi:hypothetical protein